MWEAQSITDPRQLLILLSLADVADEYGGNAYPSVSRMARDARSNSRTVQRHLSALVKQGTLEIEKSSTQHRPTTYRMPHVRGDSLSPLDAQTRHRGDTGVTNGTSTPLIGTGIGMDAHLLEVPSTNPLLGFDLFWPEYPLRNGKRLGRGKAEAVWVKIHDIEDRRAAYRGAKNYAEAVASGLTIAKDAFRWLRDKDWTDWQEPASVEQPPSQREFAPDVPNFD